MQAASARREAAASPRWTPSASTQRQGGAFSLLHLSPLSPPRRDAYPLSPRPEPTTRNRPVPHAAVAARPRARRRRGRPLNQPLLRRRRPVEQQRGRRPALQAAARSASASRPPRPTPPTRRCALAVTPPFLSFLPTRASRRKKRHPPAPAGLCRSSSNSSSGGALLPGPLRPSRRPAGRPPPVHRLRPRRASVPSPPHSISQFPPPPPHVSVNDDDALPTTAAGLWREKYASVCEPCFQRREQCPHFTERRLRRGGWGKRTEAKHTRCALFLALRVTEIRQRARRGGLVACCCCKRRRSSGRPPVFCFASPAEAHQHNAQRTTQASPHRAQPQRPRLGLRPLLLEPDQPPLALAAAERARASRITRRLLFSAISSPSLHLFHLALCCSVWALRRKRLFIIRPCVHDYPCARPYVSVYRSSGSSPGISRRPTATASQPPTASA